MNWPLLGLRMLLGSMFAGAGLYRLVFAAQATHEFAASKLPLLVAPSALRSSFAAVFCC